MEPFKRAVVTSASMDALGPVLRDYEVLVLTVLDAILSRHERRGDYPFIDTKLSVLTGEDFPDADDRAGDFKGRTAVYAWIQGRGLEALVGHARWLERSTVLSREEADGLASRLRSMIARVFDRMERIRARNAGRLAFTMTPEGVPFERDENGRRREISLAGAPSSFSDLFYAKGMLAAAHFLGLADKVDEAKARLRAILADVESDRFEESRIAFDPKNVAPGAGDRFPHGPRMISIGACCLFAQLLDEDEWFDAGERLIRRLLERHVNLGRFADLRPFDYVEALDGRGEPWRDEQGRVLSDPGHSLEFVGLASKLLLLAATRSRSRSMEGLTQSCREVFPQLFLRNFENGFNERVGGICKAFDLRTRTPINSDMPWWSLPETMRAAAGLLVLCPRGELRPKLLDAFAKCSNGFMTRFVNPDVHLFAYQTVSAEGRPVDVIPATPDADPGYHSGLSFIDVLDGFARLRRDESANR